MEIIKEKITRARLKELAQEKFGDFVKGVVDLERKILAVDAELHADLEALLLERGSQQSDLWGINLYPEAQGLDFVEFDSMINVRPSQGNRSRGVESEETRSRILSVVDRKVAR